MDRTEIARVAHEINRAYCASLGDDSQPSWGNAPDWQKASALAGVDMHLANPDATPENSHESWLAQKTAEGWKYGPVKDAEKKEHPCFLPYSELPPEQKAKDYLFRAVVHAMKDIKPPVLEAPPAPVAVVVPQAPAADNGLVAVQYVGRKPEWRDTLYGTGLCFVADQVRNLPAHTARQFLRHRDLFREAKVEVAPEPVAAAPVEVKEEPPTDDTTEILEAAKEQQEEADKAVQKVLDLKQTISFMDKDALKQFALTHYNQKLDGRLAVEALREQAALMVDQFGAL